LQVSQFGGLCDGEGGTDLTSRLFAFPTGVPGLDGLFEGGGVRRTYLVGPATENGGERECRRMVPGGLVLIRCASIPIGDRKVPARRVESGHAGSRTFGTAKSLLTLSLAAEVGCQGGAASFVAFAADGRTHGTRAGRQATELGQPGWQLNDRLMVAHMGHWDVNCPFMRDDRGTAHSITCCQTSRPKGPSNLVERRPPRRQDALVDPGRWAG